MLPPFRPSLIISLPVNLVLRTYDRYWQRYSLILQCLLTRPSECNCDPGITLQVSVLSSSGKRVEHQFERVCSSQTNQRRLRAAVCTSRCDYCEFVQSHVRQHFRFAEGFHSRTLARFGDLNEYLQPLFRLNSVFHKGPFVRYNEGVENIPPTPVVWRVPSNLMYWSRCGASRPTLG